METVLIAIGGNALYDKQSGNNLSAKMVKEVCQHIVTVAQRGYFPVVTFGNGPQVGNLLDMAETSARMFPEPITLDICVSWTQGEIGYWLSRELLTQFRQHGIDFPVAAINTQVLVDPNDAAFQKPSKPVGRFISPEEASRLYEERGWVVGPDSNRGYRRMVPSPRPIAIQEADAIQRMIDGRIVPLCCGGGGIPYAWQGEGQHIEMIGVEAVIDKDFTSCLIAKTLKLDNLIICTEVDNIYLNFGTPEQRAIERLTLEEAHQYYDEGHFAAGSMGPKVLAMMDYVENGGKRAFITSIPKMMEALDGKAGTEIYRTEVAAL
jgi:carbamate kinase